MDRREFLVLSGISVPSINKFMNLTHLKSVAEAYNRTEKMPVLFIGHGNPMNAILDNPFTHSLQNLGKSLREKYKPNAILVVSAHWLSRGTFVNISPKPKIIYDFGGFPEELFQVKYPASGSPEFARVVEELLPEAKEDTDWGLDHGAWTILKHIYPDADIPVFELSIDYYRPMEYHFNLAERLKSLRDKGVLIIGSGNIVHNLRMFFGRKDGTPYDWTIEFDDWSKEKIINKDFWSLINYEKQGKAAAMAIPTPDHYIPMLYTLGLTEPDEEIKFTYEENIGSISMRCFQIG